MASEPLAIVVLKIPAKVCGALISLYLKIIMTPIQIIFKSLHPFLFNPKFEQPNQIAFYMKFGILRGILSTLVALSFIATLLLPTIAFYITKASGEDTGWIQYLVTRILLVSISAY